LLKTIRGEVQHPLPVAFIIDCPWLPNWHGVKILDYFSSDALWLEANLKALRTFPDIVFLPGFWSEYGMCTEPSAFGARCTFPANEFPHAHRILRSSADIDDLVAPDPRTDGLLPFMLNRLKLAQPHIRRVDAPVLNQRLGEIAHQMQATGKIQAEAASVIQMSHLLTPLPRPS